jgi:hypothetical protein
MVYDSAKRVERWVEDAEYMAYEPFDGLSSPLRRLGNGSLLFDRLLMQAVRQCPINVRPLLGIKPLPSTKGRGYMAAAYLKQYALSLVPEYRQKAVANLEWLIAHKSPKFLEFSWANHFDFASRAGRYGRDESIIVWSGIIGQAFLDGFEVLGESRYLEIAESVCRWILSLPRENTRNGSCVSYYAIAQSSVHNANMIGAACLARTWRHARRDEYLETASKAIQYTCERQRDDGSWWYAEDEKYHWIDSFHTGYNLDSLRCYIDNTGDRTYAPVFERGLEFFKRHFVTPEGCPRYYYNRTQPVDIQCAAQAIETLAECAARDNEALELSRRVAMWTIRHMQANDGHFYYRLYPLLPARTPMLHWGQATMYHAFAVLLRRLIEKSGS